MTSCTARSYQPAALELAWANAVHASRVGELEFQSYCTGPTRRALEAHLILRHDECALLPRNKGWRECVFLPRDPADASCMRCGGERVCVEPLVEVLRNPRVPCMTTYTLRRPGRKSSLAIERMHSRSRSSSDRDAVYTGRIGNLSHGLSVIDDRSWLWLSSLPPRVASSRALLFDVGASTWSQGGWHGDAPGSKDGQSLHWLWDTYEQLGVSFDQAWAWEATPYSDEAIWGTRLML